MPPVWLLPNKPKLVTMLMSCLTSQITAFAQFSADVGWPAERQALIAASAVGILVTTEKAVSS